MPWPQWSLRSPSMARASGLSQGHAENEKKHKEAVILRSGIPCNVRGPAVPTEIPDILSGILPAGILSDILLDILSGILSGLLSGLLCGILSGILSGMCSGPGPAHSLLSSPYGDRVRAGPQHPELAEEAKEDEEEGGGGDGGRGGSLLSPHDT
eukprot:s186_g16.t2